MMVDRTPEVRLRNSVTFKSSPCARTALRQFRNHPDPDAKTFLSSIRIGSIRDFGMERGIVATSAAWAAEAVFPHDGNQVVPVDGF